MNRVKRQASIRRIRGSEKTLAPRTLAMAIGVAVSTVTAAQAQDESSTVEETANPIELIEVFGQRNAPYKAVRSGDLRRAADLAATPQTMTILTQTQILDSGKTDLKEILAAQAGITLGTGENGNAFGDRYIIRGHEARSDVFVDGVRDPGMTTRESFATEQIEITKGPSSTFAGRGSSGGAVNGITKAARLDEGFAITTGGFGSDDYHRFALDLNRPLGDQVAIRANLLHADENVPDRAPATRKRVGGLISGLWQATDRLSFVADYYRLEADDQPDLGGYFDRDARKPVEDVPVYLQDGDFLDTQVDAGTLKTQIEFSDALQLQNITRYGRTDNRYVTTGARGAVRDRTDPEAPGAPTFSLSTHQGWQEVDYFVNQLNVIWETDLAGVSHRMVFGLEYADEDVVNGVFDTETTGAANCVLPGRRGGPARPGYCGLDASSNLVSGVGTLMGRTAARGGQDSHFQAETVSAYLMDSFEFGTAWSAFLGIRNDRFDYANLVRSRSGNLVDYAYSDGFWNGHAGLIRDVNGQGNVYFTFSTATNINGGESDVGGNCGYGGLCGTPDQVDRSDPEHVRNLELGTKWQFLDNRLLATAALFQVTKSDVMESVGDSYSSLGTLNTGKNRVEGMELSLAGALTDRLSAQISAAFMESEVLEAFNPGHVGLVLSNFADDSFYLLLRYEVSPRLYFGGSYTYKSEMYGGQPDTAAGFSTAIGDYNIVVPSYDVVDIFMAYQPTERLNLRLNVGNLTDETHWTAAYRSGSFMYIGERRSIRASVRWEF